MRFSPYSIRALQLVTGAVVVSALLSLGAPPVLTASASDGVFNYPAAVAVSGTHVWIANFRGDSVTELNASNGSLVHVINATTDGFNAPRGVSVGGTHVWVTNGSGNSVTELNALNGSLARIIH